MNKAVLMLCVATSFLGLGLGFAELARAMEPPPPGMIEQMKRDGIYEQALARAERLGNHKLRAPKRGAGIPETDPQRLAELISQHMGQSLDTRSGKAVSSMSQVELSWTQLDLNHDRTVDERDLLVLGYPRPKETAEFPTTGTVKLFTLLFEFSDYPHYYDASEMHETMFGAGSDAFYYRGLTDYYKRASYNQLNLEGTTYGWHMASRPRTWYHPDDSNSYPDESQKQNELVMEAILAADAAGADFSQYDNDGDGSVDTFLCIWTGPHGAWATFWWGYFGVSLPADFVVDGVNFTSFSWQWERYYGFGETPPEPPAWDPLVTIHETGHALGLPDYYDYDGGQGPPGGVGSLDMMHGNWGDHGCFSKYVLGWLTPTFVFSNLNDHPMRATALYPDAVLVMPGYDPVSPWQEYFMAQNRHRVGLDSSYPSDGMLLWHVDARVSNGGGFNWDNSYTDHKLIRLLQADGLDEIENGTAGANAGDYYNAGEEFGPATYPVSERYDGSATNVSVNDISADGETMTADFSLYTSNPPSVTINAPTGGETITGTWVVDVSSSDDVGVSRVQLLIDGLPVLDTTNANFTYNWNSLVDFNKPLSITARAWDAEGQAGSATVGVTVNNAGITNLTDIFTSAGDQLFNWRSVNYPMVGRGQRTQWSTRASPANPPRGGAGNEAWVQPATYNNTNYGSYDSLRSSRIDATGFTRPLQLRFNYRNRGGLSLWATTDEGLTWQQLESEATMPYADAWATYNKTFDFSGQVVYFRFHYTGLVRGNTSAGQGGNIADFELREAPSNPPQVSFTSPADGAVLSGDMVFDVDATDDDAVAQVKFYILGSEVNTDSAAPWQYTRDTVDDDNDPALLVEAVAIDSDGLPSSPAQITVALRNPKAWPAADDFENDLSQWQLWTNGSNQEFVLAAGQGEAGSAALSYDSPGAWQTNTDEGIYFLGSPPPAGRQSVDLSDPLSIAPAVSYSYRGQLANNQNVSVYWYSTWRGYQWVGSHGGNQPGWTPYTFSLVSFLGQSGRLLFYIFGNNQSNGVAGFWDNVNIGNSVPVIDGVFPNTGYPGQVVLVSGNFFGAAQGSSTVSFGGAVCQPSDTITWANNSIYIRVPDGAADGDVLVQVDGQTSNGMPFTVTPLAIGFSGVDPANLYDWTDAPLPLTVTVSAGIERVSVWVDGVKYGESTAAPGFADLTFDIAKVPNGNRNAVVQGYSANSMVTSAPAPFRIYSLPGDVNGDGLIGDGDAEELRLHLGAQRFGPGYEFWFDPDDDGVVTEADLSFIGYNWGSSL